MAKEATFKFTGKDNVSEALKTINDNVQKVTKATKNAARSINTFNAALTVLKVTINGIVKVVSFALSTIVKLVQSALKTLKNIITGLFKFIKTALTTLLSWVTKALGKVFDGIKKLFTNIFNFSKDIIKKVTQVIKKGIETIIDSVQSYADKEYNEIQLKVSLGDSYDQVMKDFRQLLRYTTADKNDLLSVFATYAELGKEPNEIMKYAKATVYLANATGRSLSQIQRLLLGQEAAGSDLERTMKRLGINISEQEDSISNIEKIINQLDDEMQDLAKNSLNQTFANVKNNLITIKEQIGQLFAGPVRYVAQSLDKLLTKLANSNKITDLTNKIDKLFDEKIKPVVDMLVGFFERFIQDPRGFFEALWADVKQIGKNFFNNLSSIIASLGKIFGTLFNRLIDLLDKVDWYSIGETLGSALSATIDIIKMINWDDFLINVKHVFTEATKGLLIGLEIIETEDLEDSLSGTLINAWNRAYPDFQLSKEKGTWFSNLVTIFQALWEESLKPFYNKNLKPILDDIVAWVTGPFATVMGEVFSWLGEVLSATFTNILINSDVLKKIMSALGMPMVSSSDRDEIYRLLTDKGFLPQGMTLEQFRNIDMNKHEDWMAGFATWQDMIAAWGQSKYFTEEEHDLIRRYARAGKVVEEKYVPTFNDLADRITNALHPVVDELEDPVEWLKNDYHNQVTQAIKDALRETTFKVTGPVYGPAMGVGSGGGGIQDYFATSNEFKIRPFAKGGLVDKPTIALIGEAGPELIIPAKNIPKLGPGFDPSMGIPEIELGYTTHERTTGGGGVNTNPGYFLSSSGTWRADNTINRFLDELGVLDDINEVVDMIGEDVDNLNNWWTDTKPLPDVEEKTPYEAHLLDNTWIDKLGRKIIRGFDYFFSGDWVDDIKNGLLKGADSLGAFLDKITEKIEGITWRDIKNGIAKLGEGIYSLVKQVTIGSFKGVDFLAEHGAFGTHLGNIYQGSFDENGTFSILKMFGAIIQELIPYLEEGLSLIGGLFDEAFEILANTVRILGERLGKQLLPILEAFIPLMKIISDILIALAPVMESVLQPAIMIITAILQALVPILDMLMPIFAGIGAVIQWVAESISYVVGSVINWLASWLPIKGVGELKKPGSIKSNYNTIMDAYYTARATPANTITASSTSTASQTASYNGASVIHIHNDFSGSYVVGTNGFRELALIIKNTLEDIDYSGQSV